MKHRNIEINERARKILKLKRNFRRQIKLVNPNGPNAENYNVPGYSNSDVARLLIQLYGLIRGKNFPTKMIEEDNLVGKLIGEKNIVPIGETSPPESFDLLSHYDFGLGWPENSEKEKERLKYKFGGIC